MSFISRYLWKKKPVQLVQTESNLSLKALSGRFGVGFVDVEWEDTELLAVPETDLKLLGHDLPYVLARIYYPTSQTASAPEQCGTWLPSSHYFPGYGYFMRLPSLVSSGIGRLLAANVRLPAIESAPLLPIRTFEQEQFPVALFSHGLGGIRTTYATICCELASRGMIVVALEHRDGSASMTVDRDGRVFPYVTGPSGVTLPMVDYPFRSAQLRHRINELKATLKFLQRINECGQATAMVAKNACRWLKDLKGRLMLDRLCLVGHSFGGGTCLAAAQQMLNVSCCIAYDPWMFPMPQPRLHVHRTDIDTLVVLNSTFSWPENDFAINQFMEAMRETGLKKTALAQVCLQGTGHMDQSDLCSIVPARIIQMIRPNIVMPTTPHNILQISVDLAAAHLSRAFRTFHFDPAYSMAELEEHLRKDDEDCSNPRINLAKLLVKIESCHNYADAAPS